MIIAPREMVSLNTITEFQITGEEVISMLEMYRAELVSHNKENQLIVVKRSEFSRIVEEMMVAALEDCKKYSGEATTNTILGIPYDELGEYTVEIVEE